MGTNKNATPTPPRGLFEALAEIARVERGTDRLKIALKNGNTFEVPPGKWPSLDAIRSLIKWADGLRLAQWGVIDITPAEWAVLRPMIEWQHGGTFEAKGEGLLLVSPLTIGGARVWIDAEGPKPTSVVPETPDAADASEWTLTDWLARDIESAVYERQKSLHAGADQDFFRLSEARGVMAQDVAVALEASLKARGAVVVGATDTITFDKGAVGADPATRTVDLLRSFATKGWNSIPVGDLLDLHRQGLVRTVPVDGQPSLFASVLTTAGETALAVANAEGARVGPAALDAVLDTRMGCVERALAPTGLPVAKDVLDAEREKGRLAGLDEAIRVVELVAGNYPVEAFPEDGTSVDAISARAIRHGLGLVKKEILERCDEGECDPLDIALAETVVALKRLGSIAVNVGSKALAERAAVAFVGLERALAARVAAISADALLAVGEANR